MAQSEMKNAPPLYGWVIATAAGAVAFGVSLLVVGIEGNGSVAIGAVVALVVGIVFTIAESPPKPMAPPASPPKAAPAPTVASAPAAAESIVAPSATATADAVSSETESSDPVVIADEVGTKPEMLSAPDGTADDLKQITGVGPVLEGKLNDLGVYHFWQIARWSEKEVAWVDDFLNFKGRIERDEWIKQATDLAKTSAAKPPA